MLTGGSMGASLTIVNPGGRKPAQLRQVHLD